MSTRYQISAFAILILGLTGCDEGDTAMQPTNVFLNANALTQRCNRNDPQSQNVCGGYLVAVADSIEHYRAALPYAEAANYPLHTRVCLPDNIAVTDLIQSWNDWINANTGVLDNTAYSMAVQAYSERWPCKSD